MGLYFANDQMHSYSMVYTLTRFCMSKQLEYLVIVLPAVGHEGAFTGSSICTLHHTGKLWLVHVEDTCLGTLDPRDEELGEHMVVLVWINTDEDIYMLLILRNPTVQLT